jgi:hypothetical protein
MSTRGLRNKEAKSAIILNAVREIIMRKKNVVVFVKRNKNFLKQGTERTRIEHNYKKRGTTVNN